MSEQNTPSVENIQKPRLIETSIIDDTNLLSGFTDLFTNKHFWIVMVFIIAIIIGIYYYQVYIKKDTNLQLEDNNQQQQMPQMQQHQQMPQMQQQQMPQMQQQQMPQMQQQQMPHQQMQQPQLQIPQPQMPQQHETQNNKPRVNHPSIQEDEMYDMPSSKIMELEEENDNVQNQKLTNEEIDLLTKQLESQE